MKIPGYAFLREMIAVFLGVLIGVVSNFCVACNFKSQ